MGICFFHQGNLERAEESFKKGIKLNAENPRSWIGLANVFNSLKEWNTAKVHIDHAIKLAPQIPDAYAIKGNTLIQQGKFEEAINVFDEALNIDPNHLTALELKAYTYILLQDFERAKHVNLSALAINPNSATVFNNTGWRFLKNGKNREKDRENALAAFQEALKIDPENKSALLGYKSSIQSSSRIYRYSIQLKMYIFRNEHVKKQVVLLFYTFSMGWGVYSFFYRSEILIVELLVEVLFLVLVLSAIPFNILQRLPLLYLLKDKHNATLLSSTEKASIISSHVVILIGSIMLFFSGISFFTGLFIIFIGIIIGKIDGKNIRYQNKSLIVFFALEVIFGALFVTYPKGQEAIGWMLILTTLLLLRTVSRIIKKNMVHN